MKFFRYWLETTDLPWIGIIDPYDSIHGTSRESTHEKIWPNTQKRWRYRPGTGLVTLWWNADEEEKYNIRQWLDRHGSHATKFINAYG
jgi:hypothetical protein